MNIVWSVNDAKGELEILHDGNCFNIRAHVFAPMAKSEEMCNWCL